jgi:hypothetical protein
LIGSTGDFSPKANETALMMTQKVWGQKLQMVEPVPPSSPQLGTTSKIDGDDSTKPVPEVTGQSAQSVECDDPAHHGNDMSIGATVPLASESISTEKSSDDSTSGTKITTGKKKRAPPKPRVSKPAAKKDPAKRNAGKKSRLPLRNKRLPLKS